MTPAQALLIDCLRLDPEQVDGASLRAMADEDWDAFLAIAARQHVRPLVRRRLATDAFRDVVPRRVLDVLSGAHLAIRHHSRGLQTELTRLVVAFNQAGIPVILLKGAHVAATVYDDAALREIGDLDLMVRREHLERAAALLQRLGYAASETLRVDLDVAVSHHLSPFLRPPGFQVELHWNLTEPGHPYTIDPAPLWGRAEAVPGFDGEALGLAPEDLLLHLCLHSAYSHRFEFGLRSLCDIAWLLQRRGRAMRWDVIEQRATACHWLHGTRLALRLARDLLGAPIPAAAETALHLEGVAPDVVDTASALVLGGYDPEATRMRRITALAGERGTWRRWQFIVRQVLQPRDVLRKKYPWVPSSPWIWWTVYVWRSLDLLRHAGSVRQVWMAPDSATIDLDERRRRLLAYLMPTA